MKFKTSYTVQSWQRDGAVTGVQLRPDNGQGMDSIRIPFARSKDFPLDPGTKVVVTVQTLPAGRYAG